MKRSLILGLFLLALPQCVLADTIENFALNVGGQVLAFSLPSSPAFVDEGDNFYVTNVNFTLGSTTLTAAEIAFYDTAVGGGFALGDQNGNVLDGLAFIGDQVFSGSSAMPLFGMGTFNLTSYSGDPTPLQLVVTPASTPALTPEPSSFILLASGALSLLALRRKVVR